MDISGYELSRDFFDYSFSNPDTITPNHIALYFFCIEHCNRLGWKEKFSLPTTMVMEGICMKSYKTYSKTLNDLINLGFLKLIQKSQNQYSANVISLVKNNKTRIKSLDNAITKHVTKKTEKIENNTPNCLGKKDQSTDQSTDQSNDESTVQSTIQLNDSINKPITYNIEQQHTEEKNNVVDEGRKVVLKSLKTATDSKKLPDHIQELCENLISNKFKFLNITDEILETDVITFYNKDKYLSRRKGASKIKDVFYFASNGCKFHSLLDLAIYLSTDEISISQIKTTTRLPDESILDWVLHFIEHIFTEGRGLNANDAKRNMKYCWKLFPGEQFRIKLHAPKYNQLPK